MFRYSRAMYDIDRRKETHMIDAYIKEAVEEGTRSLHTYKGCL